MDKKLINEFKNPGSQYRGAPFWAWNGKLDPEELRRQVRLMHRMGLGGFFMHSRVGLDTPYLSPEWFECVKACVDEAEKLDMQAWLYDEDRWPSGAAGGLVTKNPAYRARKLVMEEVPSRKAFKKKKNTLALFTARLQGTQAKDVCRLKGNAPPRKLPAGQRLLQFYVEEHGCSSWYNGQAYLDTLNHKAVKKFIEVTHEAYRRQIGRQLGKRIPGIFTDEPNFTHVGAPAGPNRTQMPWTGSLAEVFRMRYGYDLVARLPELFFDVPDRQYRQTRYHFMDCVTHLFVEAFARQIGDWCDKNNMQHTGHVLLEDTPRQITSTVGNNLRFYEHMQAPGMDLLTEHTRFYDTAKMVSSVAHQFDRKWRLTETYGCTGWDFPFRGHKALGDWQAALGINLRCQHLAWYTMEGEAKRDYPAGIFYQSPWWEQYRKVEDYYGRVHAAMTRGREVRDLVVIYPIESMWLNIRKGWLREKKVQVEDDRLVGIRDALLTEHIDFDYGDEEIMARHGRVTGGAGPVLRINKAAYKAVLLPALTTIRSSTLALLKRFKQAGGTVIMAGPAPQYVDAVKSNQARQQARQWSRVPTSGKPIADAAAITRRISICNKQGHQLKSVLYLLREDRDGFCLFMCNTGHRDSQLKKSYSDNTMVVDRRQAYPAVLVKGLGECNGVPLELDPDTGNINRAEAEKVKGSWVISTSLAPLGSRIFVIPKKAEQGAYPKRKALKKVRRGTLASREWDITRSEENVLVLDRPQYRVGQGRWEAATEILEVDAAVRNALGIPRRGGQMTQPWAREKKPNPRQVALELTYTFNAEVLPTGGLYLALEQPRTFAVSVNGTSLDTDSDCGWWCDRSLRKLRVNPAALKHGTNTICLTCRYSEDHPGLEIMYLLGNFGVRQAGADLTLMGAPSRLRLGDWVRQGLPFYSGSISYGRRLTPRLKGAERLFVKVPEFKGAAVRVLVDGKEAGVIGWEPFEVDITDYLDRKEPAHLQIEVIGHRRNSHGPHHWAEKWPQWTGPGQYIIRDRKWANDYQLVPCGLMKAPVLEVRK